MPLLVPSKTGLVCAIRVTPRAGRTAIAGVRDDTLLVRLAAAPVDGAANEALVELLSRTFGLPRRAIRVVSGEKSRIKRVELSGATASGILERLRASSVVVP